MDFDHDYIAEIDDYMFERTKNNVFTIMGGDTNHPQNEGIHQLIIDWHRPSNITNNSNDELVDFDRRDKNKLKSYDGFCVAPTQTTYAHITEEKGKYFLMDANGKTCKALDYEPATLPNYHHQHFSILGRPWKRTVHILKDLDKQLGEEVVPLQRKRIFDEIQKIASTRLSINDFNSDPRTEKLLHAKQYKVFSELLHTNGYQGSLPRIMNSTVLDGSPNCTIDLNKQSFLVALEFSSKAEATNFRNHFGWTKELQGPNQQIISLMPNDVAKLNLNSPDMLKMLLGPLLPAPIQNPAVQSTSSTSYKR